MAMSEREAVNRLLAIARAWPKNLWLFSANGELHVMRKDSNGERARRDGGMDPDYIAAVIPIENDGGDW